MGLGPFELCYGQQPLTPHVITLQHSINHCPAAYRLGRQRQEMMDEAKDSVAIAQQRMKYSVDLGHQDVEYKIGDLVMLWGLAHNMEEDQ